MVLELTCVCVCVCVLIQAPVNWVVVSALLGSTALTLLTTGFLEGFAGFLGFDPAVATFTKPICHAIVAAYFVETRLAATFYPPPKED